jgi:hypothetical protein
MQIGYHKTKVYMNPEAYDTKGILSGYQFPEIDPPIYHNDSLIL